MRSWVLLVVVLGSPLACSSGDDGAGDVDAMATADAPPVAQGTVTVAVFDDGEPAAGVAVVFYDGAGEVQATVRTGPDGEAEGPAGGLVTVARTTARGRELASIAGGAAGDRLVVGSSRPRRRLAGTLVVTAGNEVENAADYLVDAGCAQATTTAAAAPFDVALPAACLSAEATASVFVASRTADQTPYSYAAAEGVAVAGATPVPVTLPPWTLAWGDVYLRVTHVPGGLALVANVSRVAGGVPFRAVSQPSASGAYEGATSSFLFRVPQAFGDAGETGVSVLFGDEAAGVDGESDLVRVADGFSADLEIDGGELLPRLSGVTVADGPTVRWPASAALAAGDAAVVVLDYQAGDPVRWVALLPPGTAGELGLPALPDDLADWRPGGAPSRTTVAYLDADFVDGFDAVKRTIGPDLLEVPIPAGGGTLRASLGATPPLPP